MTESLSTTGSIALHLTEIFPDLSAGISGNLAIIVDLARQHVENYTGDIIGSNSILDKYQPAILDLAKADVIDLHNAQTSEKNITLSDISLSETGEEISAKQYRLLAEMKLSSLGRNIQFAQSIS